MSDKYDLSNFTAASVPRSYNTEVRAMVAAAVSLGWTLNVAGNQNITLVSPKKEKTISLNPRKKSQPVESLQRTIHRYANPLLVPRPEEAMNRAKQMESTALKRLNTQAVQVFGTKDMVETMKVVKEMPDPATTVVYEGPMRSKNGDNGAYESDVATEVEYGDGRREFFCTRCDWHTDKSPRSVSGHWLRHVNEDAKAKGHHTGPKAELQSETSYRPNADRLESLKQTLLDAMSSGEIDWSDLDGSAERLALEALTWDHERRMTHGEPQELTAEQILDRIRHLVDGGKYAERMEEINSLRKSMEEMAQTVASQAESLDNALRTIEDVQHERDEARNNLKALRELLDGLGE